MEDMSELYGLIVQLRELSAKKDCIIDELMDMCKKLQKKNEGLEQENEELRQLVRRLRGTGVGPQ